MPCFDRRQFVRSAMALTLAGSIVSPHTAAAQAYPTKPITLVTAFAAGSPQDVVVRAMAEIVAADLKQPVIVDNKPGAAGGIALGATVTQKPDGYAINVVNAPGLTNLPLMQKLPYDPANDFDYIMQLVSFPVGIAIKAESPIKSWADLVAHAKANPGKITYGTPGKGSMANLGMQRMQSLAGISLTHVPHKGVMEIIPAVLGDHVTLMVTGTEWKPQLDSGRMRLLMMWTGTRLPAFKDVPTARENGYPFELDVSVGLIAPKGLEPAVHARLHSAFKSAYDQPSVRAQIEKFDMVPSYLDGPTFKARMAAVATEMKPIIEQLGLHAK